MKLSALALGFADPAHAGVDIGHLQDRRAVAAGVLHAAIGVMDEASRRPPNTPRRLSSGRHPKPFTGTDIDCD
jgi:hypothetical protein